MPHRKQILMGAGLIAACCSLAAASHAEILTKEPAMGAMRENERVLVDDGSCGPGKIREVIGGNHVDVGGFKRIKRVRRCIDKR